MTTTAEVIPNLFRLNPPTAVPCPDWCDLPTGHAYDSEDENDGSHMRWHVVRLTESEAVTVEALGTWREGRETLGEPRICMWFDESKADDIDADTARRHAAALLEAAKVLEELQSR